MKRTYRWMEKSWHNKRKRLCDTLKWNDKGMVWNECERIQTIKRLEKRKFAWQDNMTNIELVLNMLAEVTTTTISKQENPKTFEKNKKIARRGGSVASDAKKVWRRNRQKGNFPTQCKQ